MTSPSTFKFCPHCASPLDNFFDAELTRGKCPSCDWIHYRNPTVGVAVVLVEDEQLLIGRRQDGGLYIPCGHVEWNESIEDAARREFEEETGLQIALSGVIAVKSNFHSPEHQTVGVWYQGRREGGELCPGGDLSGVGFVHFASVPPLKFPTDNEVVRMLRSAT